MRRAEAIRASTLASLDAPERHLVETVTSQLVARLLHEPTVGLRRAAAEPEGAAYAQALEHLFALRAA